MLPTEMGGYLPLELRRGHSFFHHIPEECVLAVNTGRTAIRCAVEALGVKVLYVPAYYCPDIIAMLRTLPVELRFYRIGRDLLPLALSVEPDAAVILVNYFGAITSAVCALSQQYSRVIIDHAHGFFTPPVLRRGVMNIYSCRKFFGVSDGAYLIGRDLPAFSLEQDISCGRAGHLFKSIELGTNGAYPENKANEEALGKAALSMSVLTGRILESIDYADVERRRRQNFAYLHENLKDLQGLTCLESDSAAYMYPLLLDKDIHRALVSQRIYVPVLWSQLLEPEWKGTTEQEYSTNLVPLPLDQRYGEAELAYMIRTLRQFV